MGEGPKRFDPRRAKLDSIAGAWRWIGEHVAAPEGVVVHRWQHRVGGDRTVRAEWTLSADLSRVAVLLGPGRHRLLAGSVVSEATGNQYEVPVVLVFDTRSGAEVGAIVMPDRTRDVALSPDGATLATAHGFPESEGSGMHGPRGPSDCCVRVWEVASGRLRATITHDFVVDAVTFDGGEVIGAGLGEYGRAYCAQSAQLDGSEAEEIDPPLLMGRSLMTDTEAVVGDLSLAITGDGAERALTLALDWGDGATEVVLERVTGFANVAWVADGEHLMVWDGVCWREHTLAGEVVGSGDEDPPGFERTPPPEDPLGRVVASGLGEQRVVRDEERTHWLFGPEPPVDLGLDGGSFVFAPAGRWLAALASQKLHLWDARTGERRAIIEVHRNMTRPPVFAADAPRLAVCFEHMARQRILLLDLETLEPVGYVQVKAPPLALALSADGTRLALSPAPGVAAVVELER